MTSVDGIHSGPGGGIVDVGVLGTVVRIRTPDRESTALVRRAWHLALLPEEGPPGREVPRERTVHMPDAAGFPSAPPEDRRMRAMVAVTQAVTRAALTARKGQAVHLHAGGICHRESGAAFVYVAPGGTGKTTLTRALGPAHAYLSDETIEVREDGTITPYLKPLSVRRVGGDGIKDELAPGEHGLVAPVVTPWIAGLVILRRVAGAALGVEPLGMLDALVALSPETSAIAALDRPLQRVAEVVGRARGVRVVTYSDAGQLAPLVDDAMGRVT